MRKKKIPRRTPNVDTYEGATKTYYKDDNITIDYVVITKKDGTKIVRYEKKE